MTWAQFILRYGAITVVVAALAFVSVAFLTVRSDVEALRDNTHENLLWTSSQLQTEYLRFMGTLAQFQQADPPVDAKEVNRRFDVLWSRIVLFFQGEVAVQFERYPDSHGIVQALFDTVLAHEEQVEALADTDTAAAARIEAAFAGHGADLRSLNRDVLYGEDRRAAGLREQLFDSSNILALVAAATVLLAVVVLIAFGLETRRYRRIANENRRLYGKAEAAARTKSKFLTMMSHELRTPMNGILGMIELARQHGVNPVQERLLDKAAGSSRQMNDLLADVLDYSALEDQTLELDYSDFRLIDLQGTLHKALEPMAQREGISFTSAIEGEVPARVTGDLRRTRQVVLHLADYLAETAGTSHIALALRHSEGRLEIGLSFIYAGSGSWRPEFILGDGKRDEQGGFASDALGPAIARGLLKRMGGSIALGRNEELGTHEIRISLPAVVVEDVATVVRVELDSIALSSLVKSYFGDGQVRFHEEGDTRPPDMVVLQAETSNGPARVQALRQKYPNAQIIGLGLPRQPELFDQVLSLPLKLDDPQSARATMLRNSRRSGVAD